MRMLLIYNRKNAQLTCMSGRLGLSVPPVMLSPSLSFDVFSSCTVNLSSGTVATCNGGGSGRAESLLPCDSSPSGWLTTTRTLEISSAMFGRSVSEPEWDPLDFKIRFSGMELFMTCFGDCFL